MSVNPSRSARLGSRVLLPREVWARLERVLERFEDAWRRGERPHLDGYLAEAGPGERQALLVELIHTDLHYRLEAGEPARLETYLERYPELWADQVVVLELVVAEYQARQRREVGLSPAGYLTRFPEYEGELLARLPPQGPDSPGGMGPSSPTGVPDPGFNPTSPHQPPSASWGETAQPANGQLPSVPGYQIQEELGRGGMGVVYKAKQTKVNRVVALKMILAGAHAGADALPRFQTEAEAIGRLQHPNIVQVFEVGEHNGLPFFSLEFCPQGSLDRKLAGTPLPPPEAAGLVQTLARAMHAAHQANVVHRDLKPANVLLSADGTPKVTDFGLARKLDEASQTATGAVVGTPSYMAPEQAQGKKGVGPAADIYALGAILYECLTGRPPFKAATSLDTILQVMNDDPVSPRQLNTSVPRDLETVCLKCLEKQPERRYASAQELADDLGRFLAGEPIQGRRPSRIEQAWRWVQRNPTASTILLFLILQPLIGAPQPIWIAAGAVPSLFLANSLVLNAATLTQKVVRGLCLLALVILGTLFQDDLARFYLAGWERAFSDHEPWKMIGGLAVGVWLGIWLALFVGVPSKLVHRRTGGSFPAILGGSIVGLVLGYVTHDLVVIVWYEFHPPPLLTGLTVVLVWLPLFTTAGSLSGALLNRWWGAAH
jgi:serine/threonine protein kinase